jgi:hypothetical protein
MKPFARHLRILLMGTSLLHCRSPATAVVVSMSAEVDERQPMLLTVRATSSDESAMFSTARWARGVGAGAPLMLPSSFTVVPKDESQRSGPVTLFFDVELPPTTLGESALRWTQRVRFRFVEGKTLQVRVVFSPLCGRQATDCPASMPRCTLADQCLARGLTCGASGRCESPDIPVSVFEYDAQFSAQDATTSDEHPDAEPSMDVADARELDASMDAPFEDSTSPEDASPPLDTRCTPRCAGRVCGDDGCGGSCGSCPSRPNAASSCDASGQCQYACNLNFGDCNGAAGDGCETSLDTAMNCGACGVRCPASTPTCNAATGSCVLTCPGSQTLCGSSCVDTNANVNHCGACANACPARPNAVSSCAAGRCSFTCNSGFGDCDGDPANGCETNLGTVSNCGMCGRVCSYPNATALCTAGSCARGACNAGFADCDGTAANGCETSITTTMNCGGCGVGCTGGQLCMGSTCRCPMGQALCGGTCQPANGTPCSRPCHTGSTIQCTSGTAMCTGGTPLPDNTDCGNFDGRICRAGVCACRTGQCYRCGECQACTGACR